MDTEKAVLHHYLVEGRDALTWKLQGLGEHDARRPLTPTGTNLLGLVRHVAFCAAGYFGETFDRPFPAHRAWPTDESDPLADLWVPADLTRADVLDLHERAWAHADATIDALDLTSVGRVPWWQHGDHDGSVTLHRVMVHMAVETHRHAGHADILREGLDGAAGLRAVGSNLPDDPDWPAHVAQVEAAARAGAD